MTATSGNQEKWISEPVQVKKSLLWRIHNVSETHHLNTWTALGLSIDIPTTPSSTPAFRPKLTSSQLRPALSFSKEPEQETDLFSSSLLRWGLSLASSEDGTSLQARLALHSPPNAVLTYKVRVKIGRTGQLPLCPPMSSPREIVAGSGAQAWKILALEQLCAPANGLISEDSMELYVELVCYGSKAQGDGGTVQYHPAQWAATGSPADPGAEELYE